ncbi:MAG: tetratricopeptide repeat protein [Candidatus Hodarchaeota archaeon]
MHLLRIQDLSNGYIQVSWYRGKDLPRETQQLISYSNPLTQEDQKELQWYLEEYIDFPFGAEELHAQYIAEKMSQWGESLFSSVFGNNEASLFYHLAVDEGLENCELCISSKDPLFLNIPWEIIRDPTPGRGYLAPLMGGFYRQLIGHKTRKIPELTQSSFTVLLIISRPYGKQDIPYGTVARQIMEVVSPLRPKIKLEILRPPTFDHFQNKLNRNRGRYQLVHFDGHGTFDIPSGSSEKPIFSFGTELSSGCLVFENAKGEPDPIDSYRLGQAIATSQVPIFVINACRSAREGQIDPFSSVASQLVAIGAKGVVAMNYNVHATASALFMFRFYERLIQHYPLGEAVAAGRRILSSNLNRESIAGMIELQDWMIPTLYLQESQYTPIPKDSIENGEEYSEKEHLKYYRKQVIEVCPQGRFGFIGRDYDILEIERRLYEDNCPWILLSGLGGIGKTELAFGFARWYAETGGCPGGVFVTSFKENTNFAQVIGSITGNDNDFSLLSEEHQIKELVKYLKKIPCLLIWDNFEVVTGYPKGTKSLMSKKDQEKLATFLQALRGGKSRVIVTTRKNDEKWLKINYSFIELEGLVNRDVGELTKSILQTIGQKPENYKMTSEYFRLLKLVNGHPKSLEVILPLLRKKSLLETINAIQHQTLELGKSIDEASLGVVFEQMSPLAKKHLPILGLFISYVNQNILASLTEINSSSGRIYKKVIGETLNAENWQKILQEASDNGLLQYMKRDIFFVHPMLPPFLRLKLSNMIGEKGLDKLDNQFVHLYAHVASLFLKNLENIDPQILDTVLLEEANFLRALHLAHENDQWREIRYIVEILGTVNLICCRDIEKDILIKQFLSIIDSDNIILTETDRDKIYLLLFLLSLKAYDTLRFFYPKEIITLDKRINTILAFFVSLKDPVVQPKIALAYHSLGMIAHAKEDFNNAEKLYNEALEIANRLGMHFDAATIYHHLGMIIHQSRGDYLKSKKSYLKALKIYNEVGAEHQAAKIYHNLGALEQKQWAHKKAEKWYRKALEIYQALGMDYFAALTYLNMGRMARVQWELEIAEQWYKKAIKLHEHSKRGFFLYDLYIRLGLLYLEQNQFKKAEQWFTYSKNICRSLGLENMLAKIYHCLGRAAQEYGDFEKAKKWYKNALDINKSIGIQHRIASNFHQLGIIERFQQNFKNAEQYFKQSLEISEHLKLENVAANTYHELGSVFRSKGKFQKAKNWYHKAIEIYNRLRMEDSTALAFYNLGLMAHTKGNFKEAKKNFLKAWDFYEHKGILSLRVGTLIQLGFVNTSLKEFKESISWFGLVLTIARNHQMQERELVIIELARIVNLMGKEKFAIAWREIFNEKEDILQEVLNTIIS